MITSIIYGRLSNSRSLLNELVCSTGAFATSVSSASSRALVPYRSCVTTLRSNPSFAGGRYDH